MSLLLHGDCLEQLSNVDDNSVDLIFCDLPYGQTSCKWDTIIPWKPFWDEIMRVKKLNTPIFFTTTTKFGVELINNAPKKCPFRYDLVWVKSAPAGFLSAKKMPMRKHEMVYAFYEKLPFYDLSSHTHKFIKEVKPDIKLEDEVVKCIYNGKKPLLQKEYSQKGRSKGNTTAYDPPLPTSVVKEEIIKPNEEYDKREKKTRNTIKKEEVFGKGYLEKKINYRKYDPKLGGKGAESNIYDPPLPTSVVKEDVYGMGNQAKIDCCINNGMDKKDIGGKPRYDPPLPTSVVKEEGQMVKDFTPNKNGNIYDCPDNQEFAGRNGAPRYDPPLPTSVVKEEACYGEAGSVCYKGQYNLENGMALNQGGQKYDPPLPTSVVKEPEPEPKAEEDKYANGTINSKTYDIPNKSKGGMYRSPAGQYDPPLPTSVVKQVERESTYGNIETHDLVIGETTGQPRYDPPLPTTMLEIKSTRGKHSTEKPVALMEWILKYYSKEGDVVLDPTMGSGSTGVACKNMNRNFIGIEKDPEIYQVAVNRIED